MKKMLITTFLILLVLAYFFVKGNPPLAANAFASGGDGEIRLIQIGNKGSFGDVTIENVLVNNGNSLEQVKLQVSNHVKGFIVTDNFEGEEVKEYTFKTIDQIAILPGTDPQLQLEKLNAGTATDDDKIYALSLIHEESIEQVTIKYRHLGIPYETTVFTN